MNANIKPSDRAVLLDAINPAALAVGAANGSYISMAQAQEFLAVLAAGAIGATQTVDFKLQQASDASGTGVKDITGKAITQLGGSDDNKQAVINLRADELDVANGFDHVRMVLTVADTASPAGTVPAAALLFGMDARYQPQTDATSVAEVVS